MDIEIIETDNRNPDFLGLVELLDKDLNERYGNLQKQYDNYNQTDRICNAVILYKDKIPVACGAIKKFDDNTVELKRIFVKLEDRRQGLSKLILHELEKHGMSLGYEYAVLETGIKQIEAINLYRSCGYQIVQNFEPYIGNGNSVCMRKKLEL